MHPEEIPTQSLYPGQVGFIACNMKQSSEGKVTLYLKHWHLNHISIESPYWRYFASGWRGCGTNGWFPARKGHGKVSIRFCVDQNLRRFKGVRWGIPN